MQRIKDNLTALLSLARGGPLAFPANETLVESLYWVWHNLRVRLLRRLQPLTPAQQAEIDRKLIKGDK